MSDTITPRVLLVHALLWPNIGRLSGSFRRAGFEVGAIAPAGHPIHRMRSPGSTYIYHPTAPRAALNDAIQAYRPDLIIPCDDRVLGHLCRIYGQAAPGSPPVGHIDVRKLIEKSMGRPTALGLVSKRSLLAELSHLPDVRVPPIEKIESLRELRAWAAKSGLPAVLKLDESWGGQDVILMRRESDISGAFLEMRLRRSVLMKLKRMLFNLDIEPLLAGGTGAAINVQSYVGGRLANATVACWRGEVLASVAVEVVRNRRPFGMATVVRQVDGAAMLPTCRSVARHLDLSGLHGFDFVLDTDSNEAKLLEINSRATQIDHLSARLGGGLPAAMYSAVTGAPLGVEKATPEYGEIALFPGEWRRDRKSAHLSSAFHDIPFDEPELVRYYRY